MNNADKQYLDIAKQILKKGVERVERTGTGTIALFSPPKMSFNLQKGFPALTTKELHIPSVIHELIWFIKGDTNIKYLVDNGIKIWNDDAYRWFKHNHDKDFSLMSKEDYINRIKTDSKFAEKYGDLGPVYGKQWRGWSVEEDGSYIDQLEVLIEELKENPNSRRHIVSSWNVGQIHEMALPPCHAFFQCFVTNDGGLILQMYQRSADWFLGVPFNIASYALLTHMIAQVTGLYAKKFIWIGGDAHIYKNHIEQMKTQMKRDPRPLPTLWLDPSITDINDFKAEHIRLDGYNPHEKIKGKVSVG